MERSELVLRLVLNEIADDYENVDQIILPRVAAYAAKGGLKVERPEIVKALSKLVADGFACAYLLSHWEPYAVQLDSMPALDTIEQDFRTYFLITKKGLEFHLADESWLPVERD